jgi:hypothetical protein
MSNEVKALVVPPEIARFFKKAPLLVTEFQEDYDALFQGAAQAIVPTNILEWSSTRNWVDSQWDMRRQRIAKAGIINATRHEALRTILESILPETDDRIELAARLADEWYEKPDERHAILERLGKHDLDDDAISAQAMALRAPELEKIDRALQQLAVISMAHLREIEFYRSISPWRASKELDQVADQPRLVAPEGKAHAGGSH